MYLYNNHIFTLRASATAPAAVSALIFRLIPLFPLPIGAITGTNCNFNKSFNNSILTDVGSPTRPKSIYINIYTYVNIIWIKKFIINAWFKIL